MDVTIKGRELLQVKNNVIYNHHKLFTLADFLERYFILILQEFILYILLYKLGNTFII